MKENPKYIRWFNEVGIEDVPIVGGENASLGEMYKELAPKGVKILSSPRGNVQGLMVFRPFLRIGRTSALSLKQHVMPEFTIHLGIITGTSGPDPILGHLKSE